MGGLLAAGKVAWAPAPAAHSKPAPARASCACERAPPCLALRTATWRLRRSGACKAWYLPEALPRSTVLYSRCLSTKTNLAYGQHAKAVGLLAVQITDLRLGWEVDCVLRDILTGLSDCSAPARRLRYRCRPSSTLTRLYCRKLSWFTTYSRRACPACLCHSNPDTDIWSGWDQAGGVHGEAEGVCGSGAAGAAPGAPRGGTGRRRASQRRAGGARRCAPISFFKADSTMWYAANPGFWRGLVPGLLVCPGFRAVRRALKHVRGARRQSRVSSGRQRVILCPRAPTSCETSQTSRHDTGSAHTGSAGQARASGKASWNRTGPAPCVQA